MQKVYLLLRYNKQTGPMTLEELLKTGLKKNDLIWIEGKSAAWAFPAEIEHLKAHVPGQENVPKSPEPPSTPVLEKTNTDQKPAQPEQPSPASATAQMAVPKSRLVHVILPKASAFVQAPFETAESQPVAEEKVTESRTKPVGPESRSRLSSPPAATQKTLFPEELRSGPPANVEEKPDATPNKTEDLNTNITPEPVVPAEDSAAAARSIEEKAEAIRNRILAFNANKQAEPPKPAGIDITPGGGQVPAEPVKIEDKAEMLKAKIAAIRAAQQTALSEPLPAASSVVGDETPGSQTAIEDKAEAIRKKIAAYNTDKQSTAQQTASIPAAAGMASASPDTSVAPTPDLDQKAEDLRRKIAAYNQENRSKKATTSFTATSQQADAPALETKYAKPLTEIEAEYASWTYNTKTKRKGLVPEKRVFAIGVGILLLAGIFGIGKYAYDKASSPSVEVSTETVSDSSGNANLATNNEEKPVMQSEHISEKVVPAKPVTEQPVTKSTAADKKTPQKAKVEPVVITKADRVEMARLAKKMVLVREGKTKFTRKEIKNMARLQMEPVTRPDKKKSEPAPEKVAVKIVAAPPPAVKPEGEKIVQKTAETDAKPAPAAKKPAEVAVVSTAPKKTFSDRVDDFFSQFKKKEEPKPAVEEPAKNADGQQRTTRRRDDEVTAAPAPATINLMEQVDVTSNDPPESFLMGIHGLKVTLNNKSDHTVKTASVEVRYYNENKELLEKKIVTFSNVPPKKRVTIPAPDHRLADHADSRLLAVTGTN